MFRFLNDSTHRLDKAAGSLIILKWLRKVKVAVVDWKGRLQGLDSINSISDSSNPNDHPNHGTNSFAAA